MANGIGRIELNSSEIRRLLRSPMVQLALKSANTQGNVKTGTSRATVFGKKYKGKNKKKSFSDKEPGEF